MANSIALRLVGVGRVEEKIGDDGATMLSRALSTNTSLFSIALSGKVSTLNEDWSVHAACLPWNGIAVVACGHHRHRGVIDVLQASCERP